VSSFHIVGEIFDKVYGEGGIDVNQHNVQTTMIPVGGSAMAEFTAEVPGEYTLVDHSMFRAFDKGAMGQMVVEGAENPQIYTGQTSESAYDPGTHLQREPGKPAAAAEEPETPLTMPELMAQGGQVYAATCTNCHQRDGMGLPNAFPPLAHSDFVTGDKERAEEVLLHGLKGEIEVNGQKFNAEMPVLDLNDRQIAGVLTYVRNCFGNHGELVSVAEVAAARSGHPHHAGVPVAMNAPHGQGASPASSQK